MLNKDTLMILNKHVVNMDVKLFFYSFGILKDYLLCLKILIFIMVIIWLSFLIWFLYIKKMFCLLCYNNVSYVFVTITYWN
jgi:hypothetical protein